MNERTEDSTHFSDSALEPWREQQETDLADAVAIPVAADRLYQFAALTVGLFLLVTLL